MAIELIKVNDFPQVTEPSEWIVVSGADGVARKISKEDFKVYLGTVQTIAPKAISTSDPAPTLDGVYLPTEDGTYANAGGIVVDRAEGGVDYGMSVQIIKQGGTYVKYTEPLPEVDTSALVSDQRNDSFLTSQVSLSDGTALADTSPWITSPTIVNQWIQNSSDFLNGSFFQRIEPGAGSSVGSSFEVYIPEGLRVVGRIIRVYFSYKSIGGAELKLYYRNQNNDNWVNNAGSPTLILPSSSSEKVVTIERPYEAGVGYVRLYISGQSGSQLDIGAINVVIETIKDIGLVDVSTSVPFGLNPAYEVVNPWNAGGSTGSSSMVFSENLGDFDIGDYYVTFTGLGGFILNSWVALELPDAFEGNTNKKVSIAFSFINEGIGVVGYNIYQQDASGAWTTNVAEFPEKTLPKTPNGIEYAISDKVTIAPNTKKIVLVTQVRDNSTLKIGSVKGIVLSGEASISGSYTTITVAESGGDYTSIRAALKSITSASAGNKYRVFIKNGTYNEIDITGAPYYGDDPEVVVVEGESREGVIIKTDGKSTALSPTGYSYPVSPAGAYDNVPINTIPQVAKHVFYLQETLTVKDVTIIGNDVKYAIHQDNTKNRYRSRFVNCHIIHEELTSQDYYNVVGIGASAYQHQSYEDCIIELRTPFYPLDAVGFYWHNWGNETSPASLNAINCHIINANIAHVSELVSTQKDVVKLDGCTTNLPTGGIIYSLTQGQYEPIPPSVADYPYNIILQIHNTIVNYFELRDRSDAGFMALALNEYHFEIKNISGGGEIKKGQAIKYNYGTGEVSIASGNDFEYVAWTNIQSGGTGYGVPRNKGCQVLAVAGTYTEGTYLKVNAFGVFEATINASEMVGVCYDSKTLAAEGLIMAFVK